VEFPPVATSTGAIIPPSEIKDLPAAQLTDVANSQPGEASKLATGDSSQKKITNLLLGDRVEQ
jgi:hypothetical protein